MSKAEVDDECVVQLIKAFFSSVPEGVALVLNDRQLVQKRTGLGETALHYLCVENQINAARELIRLGIHHFILTTTGSRQSSPIID